MKLIAYQYLSTHGWWDVIYQSRSGKYTHFTILEAGSGVRDMVMHLERLGNDVNIYDYIKELNNPKHYE